LLLHAVPPDLRNPTKAVAVDEQAVKMTSRHCPSALHHLAIALAADGQMERAAEARNEALALLPSGDGPMRRELDRQWSEAIKHSPSGIAVMPAAALGVPDNPVADDGDGYKKYKIQAK
jgi:hypothetical protein